MTASAPNGHDVVAYSMIWWTSFDRQDGTIAASSNESSVARGEFILLRMRTKLDHLFPTL
jgi:hypothetical protein